MISTRIAIREKPLYAGDLLISTDRSQCLAFPDKEEVPGSSPGSPIYRNSLQMAAFRLSVTELGRDGRSFPPADCGAARPEADVCKICAPVRT
jgi:hypothetical protein